MGNRCPYADGSSGELGEAAPFEVLAVANRLNSRFYRIQEIWRYTMAGGALWQKH